MGSYKCLKIVYNQHPSIKGWGLSVNAPANSLINLADDVLKTLQAKRNITLKAFYGRVINSSVKELVEAKKEYNKFKQLVISIQELLKKAKLMSELNNQRREFAKEIDKIYDAIIDKASRFRLGITDFLKKITGEKKLTATDYMFLNGELEIPNAQNLDYDVVKEHLENMLELINEFLDVNISVIRKIKNDLKHIINRKIEEEELEQDDGAFVVSAPTIIQGPKLNEKGKLVK